MLLLLPVTQRGGWQPRAYRVSPGLVAPPVLCWTLSPVADPALLCPVLVVHSSMVTSAAGLSCKEGE